MCNSLKKTKGMKFDKFFWYAKVELHVNRHVTHLEPKYTLKLSWNISETIHNHMVSMYSDD